MGIIAFVSYCLFCHLFSWLPAQALLVAWILVIDIGGKNLEVANV